MELHFQKIFYNLSMYSLQESERSINLGVQFIKVQIFLRYNQFHMSQESQKTSPLRQRDSQQKDMLSEISEPRKQQSCICSECAFEITVELSQQILQLRQKLAWFQKQTNEIQKMQSLDEVKIGQLLSPLKTALQKEIVSETQKQKQLKHLQQQLREIQRELEQQQTLSQQCIHTSEQFKKDYADFQIKLNQSELSYRQLTSYYHHSLMQKEIELEQTLGVFQKTNFVTILYSISFENDNSLLNGEKITSDNIWKIVQILLFYQTKYQNYHPLVHIFWSEMKLETQIKLSQEINSGHVFLSNLKSTQQSKLFTKQIDIECGNEQVILNTWMPYILVEMKNIFTFLNNQIGHNFKLRYEVTDQGKFEQMINKQFKSEHDRFIQKIKYLLTDIDQINKMEFFAKQQRLKKQ